MVNKRKGAFAILFLTEMGGVAAIWQIYIAHQSSQHNAT